MEKQVMLNKADEPVQDDNTTPPYTFSDEVTKRKIRRHLKDINDVITEKDIKDAKVPGAETESTPGKPAKKTRKRKNNLADESPGNPVTPWDAIDG